MHLIISIIDNTMLTRCVELWKLYDSKTPSVGGADELHLFSPFKMVHDMHAKASRVILGGRKLMKDRNNLRKQRNKYFSSY